MRQIAVLPYRTESPAFDAPIQILLITSRQTRRWVIPKGGLMNGLPPHAAAAIEAEEEAGVIGAACPTPIGSYRYRKTRASGASVWAEVDVFPFAVTEELPTWDEQHQRERRWFSLADAAAAVDEDDLRALIRSFGAREFRAAANRPTWLVRTVAEKTGVNTMFAWFQKLLPQSGNFFEMFEQQAGTLIAGADALARLLQGGPTPAQHIREIEEREHDADEITRQVLQTVRRTFLTPFDRGAITSLITTMDDAIDEMQQTAGAADLYDITEFEPEMRDMAAIIVDCARLTAEAMPLLRNIAANGHRLHELTERLVRMEGQADGIHAAGLKRLFKESPRKDPLHFVVRQEMFKRLERVVDRFEDLANEIDGLVIDHS
jgi:predicted phosphate transport protein (TIGR00153 family)